MPDEFGRHSKDEILARLHKLDMMGDGARIIELERRVLQLTTALTEIVVIVNYSSLSMSSTTTDLLLRSASRARAVLAAGPHRE